MAWNQSRSSQFELKARLFCLKGLPFPLALAARTHTPCAKNCFTNRAKDCYFYAMEERFYREQEIARLPAFLPAATYNLAHTLLARAGQCLFVPIRSLQYMAVLDAEEFIFVDSQNKAWVELAWQHFRPQVRSALDEPVPFEVVHYLPQAVETMKRLPGEFLQALQLLSNRQKPDAPATILDLQAKAGPGDKPN
jgi:hypothetical protein